MIVHIDITGIGKKNMENTTFEMESLEEYLTIAKKLISTTCYRFGKGLAEEMLKNDDAIANIAYSIMMADLEFNGSGNRYGFRKLRAEYAIKSYLSRRKKNVDKNIYRLDNITDTESESSFADYLSSSEEDPSINIEKSDYNAYIMNQIEKMQKNGVISEKGKNYVKMHYLDEISVEKIAEKEGVSRQSVYQVLNRAMKSIKKTIRA